MSRTISTIVDNGDTREAKIQGKRKKKRRASERIRDIGDAWKNSYSCSTKHKVWAAKFTARHPNPVALEISSFKWGHDAPIHGVIERIIEQSGTPCFCFKDLD